MKTELFRCRLNQITKTLLAMTPAQRLTVQHIIQVSQPIIIINELIQPIFNSLSQCSIWIVQILLSGEKRDQFYVVMALMIMRK
jgi:hypothetical protein